MVVFVNSKGEIKDVGSTKQVDLIGVVLRDEENPFKDWPIAKICCYRIETFDGYVTMMTPYVDTRIIEHIEQLGQQIQIAGKNISETNDGLIETYEDTLSNLERVSQCEDAIIEIYEMILGEEE